MHSGLELRTGGNLVPKSVNPGDATGMRVGAALAASLETSLRLAFDVTRVGQLRAAEGAVAGSRLTIGVMEVGASTLLTPRMLLSVQAGIGLTCRRRASNRL
jgi:hypothetical protein